MQYAFYVSGSRNFEVYDGTLFVPRFIGKTDTACTGLACGACVCGGPNGYAWSCRTFKTTDTELSAKDLVERELVKQLLE